MTAQLSAVNLFAIQSEISEEISRAMRATLTDEEQSRLAIIPTDSMAAYSLYTKGRDNLYTRRLDTMQKAREQFEEAIALDPDYAEAYAGLAESVLLLLNNHQAVSTDEAFGVAEASLDKALSLNPDLADAHASLGLLKQLEWQETRSGPGLEEAEASFLAALDLNPNHASAYMWFASVRRTQRRFEEAIDLYHDSLRVDPLGKIPYSNLPGLYAQRGQNKEALDLYIKAVEIHPEWPTAYQDLALQLNGLGRMDEAVAWAMKGQEFSIDPLSGSVMAMAYMEFGEYDRLLGLFPGITPGHPAYAIGLSTDRAVRGDYAGAIAIMEKTIEGVGIPGRFSCP